MKKLNPITALYLKILEFISKLMIDIGELCERNKAASRATASDYDRVRKDAKRYRHHCRCTHRWW